MKKPYTTNELLEIAREHQHALTSVNKWNAYSETHGVPHSQTFISHFGSWNTLKEQLNLTTRTQGRPQTFEDSELLNILKMHGEHYTSVGEWNAYAKLHGLPGHHIFAKRIGLQELNNLTNYKYEPIWDPKDFKSIILKHFPKEPPTFAEWTDLVKRENVPSTLTLVRHYGKWNMMKHEVYHKN